VQPEYAYFCHGWPRAKQNPGDWIEETNEYLYTVSDKDPHACHPNQRAPSQFLDAPAAGLKHHKNPAPMATAKAGESIKLMFGGNGHSRGST